MMRLSTLSALLLGATASAQLPLSLNFQFVDAGAGGNGNIGVTQDEVALDYHVVDFSNTLTVHRFDLLGNPIIETTTTGCTPAAPSPNDVTYDSITQTLWFVDNTGNVAVHMDLVGNCLGGFAFGAASNATGIGFNRTTGNLWITSAGVGLLEHDTAGNLLSTIPFVPSSGSTILSGCTYVPETGNYLLTQSSGTSIFEIDATGALISTTSLSTFGIVNTQGLHYNPALRQISVVDNTLSTVFVFDVTFCNGSTIALGTGCVDGGGTVLRVSSTGCPDVGSIVGVSSEGSADGLAIALLIGFSDTMLGGSPILPLDLGLIGAGPGCSLYVSGEISVSLPTTGGVASVNLPIPLGSTLAGTTVYWQSLKLDTSLTSPLPLAASNYLRMSIQ